MLWDESEDVLFFPDNSGATFGTGSDLTIYHNGINSYIANTTGTLHIASTSSGVPITIGHTTSETTIGDNLIVTGYMVEGRTLIKIKATDFISNDDAGGAAVNTVEDDGSNFGVIGAAASEFYAYIDVPLGYTATKVRVNGSDGTNDVQVFTLDLDDGTISGEISNTGLQINDDTALASNHVGADDKILLIKVDVAATDDVIYGGYVTITTT